MNCNRVMDDISLNYVDVVSPSGPAVSLFDSQCPTPCLDERPQTALFPDLLSVEPFSPLKLAPSPLQNIVSEPHESAYALPSAEGTEFGPSPIPTRRPILVTMPWFDALNRGVIGTSHLAQAQSESETDRAVQSILPVEGLSPKETTNGLCPSLAQGTDHAVVPDMQTSQAPEPSCRDTLAEAAEVTNSKARSFLPDPFPPHPDPQTPGCFSMAPQAWRKIPQSKLASCERPGNAPFGI